MQKGFDDEICLYVWLLLSATLFFLILRKWTPSPYLRWKSDITHHCHPIHARSLIIFMRAKAEDKKKSSEKRRWFIIYCIIICWCEQNAPQAVEHAQSTGHRRGLALHTLRESSSTASTRTLHPVSRYSVIQSLLPRPSQFSATSITAAEIPRPFPLFRKEPACAWCSWLVGGIKDFRVITTHK